MTAIVRTYINDCYGSKRGLLNLIKSKILLHRGAYIRCINVEWERVQRLIFICHGNICRSPLANVYASSHGVSTESYGLACTDGALADSRAIRYASELGLDLTTHRTRNIGHMRATSGDLIVVMEPCHLTGVQNCELHGAQTTLAGLWLPRRIPYIHDPYSSGQKYFNRCEAVVVESTKNIIQLMKR